MIKRITGRSTCPLASASSLFAGKSIHILVDGYVMLHRKIRCEIVFDSTITFSTAWAPCSPVIAKLAELFPEAEFWFQYEECGCCFAGARLYRSGELVYELVGEYVSNPLWEEDDKGAEDYEDYIVKDNLFPIQESGTLEHTEFKYCEDGFTYENAYIREYGNGKIKYKIDGEIKYKGERPSFLY